MLAETFVPIVPTTAVTGMVPTHRIAANGAAIPKACAGYVIAPLRSLRDNAAKVPQSRSHSYLNPDSGEKSSLD